MKILLLVPDVTGQMGRPAYPHIGLSYITSYLTSQRHSVIPIDLRVSSFKYVKEYLKTCNIDFIGVTSSDLGYKKAYELISKLKKLTNAKIVIGGPHVSTNKAKVLEQCEADYAIKGEGEETFSELCAGFPVDQIKGLIWNDEYGIAQENPDRPPITDLDALPFPAYDKFHSSNYSLSEMPIVTSRGCPFFCIYCAVHCIMGYRFRPRSPENVVAEIKHWVAKGHTHFQFTDDNFTFDMDRAKRICDLIIQEQLKIKWNVRNGIRVDKVDKELLQKMKDSGCYFVFFGMESGSQTILKKIKKGITIDQIRNAVALTKEVGLPAGGTFMIGHPDETYKDFEMSLSLAKSLELDECRFYNVIPYPGTELFDWIKNHGRFILQPEDYLNTITSWNNKPVFETPYFTEKERKTAYNAGHRLYMSVLWKKQAKENKLSELSYLKFWLRENLSRTFIGDVYRKL